METVDRNAVSQVLYNEHLDIYEVYTFGEKVETFVDELVAAQLSFHLANNYQRGRLDVAQAIHYGFSSAHEVLLTESGHTEADLTEDW